MIFNGMQGYRESVGIYLVSIEVTTQPTTTRYNVGDTFNPEGMVVEATYSNGWTMTVGGYTWTPDGALAANDASVEIRYTEGGRTATATVEIKVITAHIYGVMWDYSNSSTKLTRLAQGKDPNNIANTTINREPEPAIGTALGSSPFDDLMPWSGMEEYNILSDGIIIKSGEDGFSRTKNDTMVYIPEFWYKVVDVPEESKRYWYVADFALDGFEKHPGSGRYLGRYHVSSGYVSTSGRLPLTQISRDVARNGCQAKGTGWGQYDYATYCAVWLLYIVEYADWDSQTAIGQGYVDSNYSVGLASGKTDEMGYHTGHPEGDEGWTTVQYRHLENLWGNVWQWLDGVNITNGVIKVCTDPSKYADTATADYVSSGKTQPNTNDGGGTYIRELYHSDMLPWAFILKERVKGSSSTYIPDAYQTSGSRTSLAFLYVGGYWRNGKNAGLFSAITPESTTSFSSNTYVSARLLYIPPTES